MTKGDFRRLCLDRLLFFSRFAKIKKDKIICKKLLDIINLHKPKKILLYIPLKTEVDIKPLIDILRKREGIEVYVPYMSGESFIPVKYRLPLKKGKFNIKQPRYSRFLKNEIDFDMAIVPIIGIDSTSRRVGFGKGIYDRFFETLKKRPITVFTQTKLCKTKLIVTDIYDIKADYIIT